MRLSCKIVKNYINNNSFDYANEWIIRAGEPNTLYFQLVDLDQNNLRYMPTNAPIAVSVIFSSIDDADKITAIAALADNADGSIWKIVLSASQTPKSGNVVFQISENSVIRKFSVLNAMNVELVGNDGSC